MWAGVGFPMPRTSERAEGGLTARTTGSGTGPRKGIDMNIKGNALTALGAAGLVLAGLGPVGSPAAAAETSAAADVCRVRVLSVQAQDLQEDQQGSDEVFLRLGDARTVQRSYFDGQKRNTLSDGDDHFSGSEPVALIEHDNGIGNNDLIDAATLQCETRQVTSTLRDVSADTVYTVVWRVDVIS